MNLTEALKELYAGNKIRRKAWHMNISYQLKNGAFITFDDKDFLADDWEIAEPIPILDKDEKEYLENLLKPFVKNMIKLRFQNMRAQ